MCSGSKARLEGGFAGAGKHGLGPARDRPKSASAPDLDLMSSEPATGIARKSNVTSKHSNYQEKLISLVTSYVVASTKQA
jgi:hypothetical protein